MKSAVRIEAWDRRQSALHEAGHAVIGFRFCRYPPSAMIWRNDKPKEFEKLWGGQCSMFTDGIHPDERKMIGVAGLVGESIYRPDFVADDFFDYIEEASMSATDWSIAGASADRLEDLHPAYFATVELLSRPEIRSIHLIIARRLILDATGRGVGPLWGGIEFIE